MEYGSMTNEIKDVWFRSPLPLAEIANRLGLTDVAQDAEDYWAWVIGSLDETQLDITRTHTRSANSVDTRIFVLHGQFREAVLAKLIGLLRDFVTGSISCGRWEHRSGHDFKLVVIRELSDKPAPNSDPG